MATLIILLIIYLCFALTLMASAVLEAITGYIGRRMSKAKRISHV